MRKSMLINMILTLAISNQCAAQENTTQQLPLPPLQGRIEHSESLPPVKVLRIGDHYDETKLSIGRSAVGYWWQVPKWLEGTWAQENTLHILTLKDLATGNDIKSPKTKKVTYPAKEVIGYQKDRAENTWTCVPVPYIRTDNAGDSTNVNIITEAEAVEVNDDKVDLMLTATTFTYKTSTKEITQITQRESLQTYKPLNSSTVEITSSMKFFDEDGKAIYLEELRGKKNRTKHYEQVDELPSSREAFDMINLKLSFRAYLLRHGMSNIVPNRLLH